jgi:hypothetical protein
MRCSRLPTPSMYRFVCTRYGSPVTLPRNSKSNSLCLSPPDDNCALLHYEGNADFSFIYIGFR